MLPSLALLAVLSTSSVPALGPARTSADALTALGVHHPTPPGGLGDDMGTGGGEGPDSVRCSGHPAGYPPGWVVKVVFQYNAGSTSICMAFLYQPDGTLDDCIGSGDCDLICRDLGA